VLSNIVEMANLCLNAGIELLPHAKTHRTLEFGRMQLENGASGLSVATVQEAEAFAADGVKKILLTYPLTGEMKIRRLVAIARDTDLIVATDSYSAARAIGKVFSESGLTAEVYLIVDSGMHRDGVTPTDAVGLARELNGIDGIRLTGVFTHEGHVYRSEDSIELSAASRQAVESMVSTATSIRGAGFELGTVSLGASASVRNVVGQGGVTQVRPGIYAFNDRGQVNIGTATIENCAARILATVVSCPEEGRACIDAGSKALSNDLLPARSGKQSSTGYGQLLGLPGWEIHRLSEHHGWLKWTGSRAPTPLFVGQKVEVLPNHICMAFYSLGETVVLREGEIVGTWKSISRT
jgi:D-serine deaminase-like pyridoxal phosphate-dependent protein